jgi:hypothetical protein
VADTCPVVANTGLVKVSTCSVVGGTGSVVVGTFFIDSFTFFIYISQFLGYVLNFCLSHVNTFLLLSFLSLQKLEPSQTILMTHLMSDDQKIYRSV